MHHLLTDYAEIRQETQSLENTDNTKRVNINTHTYTHIQTHHMWYDNEVK